MIIWLNTPIQMQFRVIHGLSVRFAQSEDKGDHALLLSPWPESLLAFEPVWARLANPHVIGPDIGTGASLFAAALYPGRLRSVVVGSGGAAVPLQLGSALNDWVETPDLDSFRSADPRQIHPGGRSGRLRGTRHQLVGRRLRNHRIGSTAVTECAEHLSTNGALEDQLQGCT